MTKGLSFRSRRFATAETTFFVNRLRTVDQDLECTPREWTKLGCEFDHLPGMLLFELCRALVSKCRVEPLAIIDFLDEARQ